MHVVLIHGLLAFPVNIEMTMDSAAAVKGAFSMFFSVKIREESLVVRYMIVVE